MDVNEHPVDEGSLRLELCLSSQFPSSVTGHPIQSTVRSALHPRRNENMVKSVQNIRNLFLSRLHASLAQQQHQASIFVFKA